MTINDQIMDEKLQYNINREAAKISALSSGKIHKYEYLTGEDLNTDTRAILLMQNLMNLIMHLILLIRYKMVKQT